MGDGGPFVHFGIGHLAALALFAAALLLVWALARKSPDQAPSSDRHPVLAGLVLGQFLAWEVVRAIQDDFSAANNLPLHLCDISQLLLVVYLVRPHRRVYNLVYYWGLVGAGLALVFPDLNVGFPALGYFAIFFSHGLTLVVIAYLALIEHRWPTPNGHHFAAGALILLGLAVIPVNAVTGGNYLYLFRLPPVPVPYMEVLPPAPGYWPVLLGALYLAFTGLSRLVPALGN